MPTTSQNNLVIAGSSQVPAMTLSPAQENHLRRLLAWIRVEYHLDPDMQRGYLHGATESVKFGIASERANEALQGFVDKVNSVPLPVREGVASLTATQLRHDMSSHDTADTTALAPLADFNQVQGLKDVLSWMAMGSLHLPSSPSAVATSRPLPAYVKQAIKMLALGISAHEAAAGIVETKANDIGP